MSLYPILAVADRVEDHVDIRPVYLAIRNYDKKVVYHILECDVPDPRERVPAIDELVGNRYQRFELDLTGSD